MSRRSALVSAHAVVIAGGGPNGNERAGRSEGVDGYAAIYAHARAAMVFDVVADYRRRYREVVLPGAMSVSRFD